MSETVSKNTVDDEYAAARQQIKNSAEAWSGGMAAALAFGIALSIVCTLGLMYVRWF